MIRRGALSALLGLVGLGMLLFAQLPPGLPGPWGRPWNHVPVDGQVSSSEPDAPCCLVLRYGYAFEGRRYEQQLHGSNNIKLPDGRAVADLRAGDVLAVFVDPHRPGDAALRSERWLGYDAPQILLGLTLLVAAVFTAFSRGTPRRA